MTGVEITATAGTKGMVSDPNNTYFIVVGSSYLFSTTA
jgi:hypothetical protein